MQFLFTWIDPNSVTQEHVMSKNSAGVSSSFLLKLSPIHGKLLEPLEQVNLVATGTGPEEILGQRDYSLVRCLVLERPCVMPVGSF